MQNVMTLPKEVENDDGKSRSGNLVPLAKAATAKHRKWRLDGRMQRYNLRLIYSHISAASMAVCL